MTAIVWRATDLNSWLERIEKGETQSLESLRSLLGGTGKPLGYLQGRGFTFLAVDDSGFKRSLAVMPEVGAIVTFDFAEPTPSWTLEPGTKLRHTPLQPLVNVLQWKEAPVENTSNIDMAGARVGNWVVAFHADARSARSPVSFDVEGAQAALNFLVTGLAPGIWEIWRNGWLVDPDAPVSPQAGALYFEGRPGSYFFRRLN